MPHTIQSIADLTRGDVVGPSDLTIESLAEIGQARPGQLTFIGSEKYAHRWAGSRASAALIARGIALEPGDGRALVYVDNADLAMATVLEAFAPPTPLPPAGVHASALVAPDATLGDNVRIGPNCVIKPGVTVGDNTILHTGVTLFDNAQIGSDCELWTGVVIRERCTLGNRCIVHPNAVIGADGFGYRPDTSGPTPRLVKIPQIGTVRIGNDVEIGANTTIDRAKFDATVVGDGCKLDNQVQIGHNVILGRMVVIAGCAGIGGSSVIGDGTMIGGLTCVSDHINVGPGCRIAGSSACINDIPAGETWGGLPAKPLRTAFQEEAALKQLPGLLRQIKRDQRKAAKAEAQGNAST
ncbi:MAG: UDP-3-O-(3-hydroxymyristoyl)glucosamine N-acyltransferase [Planctomycetota bacterium]